MSERKETSQTARELLALVPPLTALCGFAALVLSVIYELAYFTVVGYSFLAFMNALDYLRNAVFWLPIIIGIFGGGLALEYFLRKIIRLGDRRLSWGSATFCATGGALLVFASVLVKSPWIVMLGVVGQIGGLILNFRNLGLALTVTDLRNLNVQFGLALFFISSIITFGGLDGAVATSSVSRADYRVEFGDAPAVDARILKVFDKGVVLFLPAKRTVEFRRVDEIRKIERTLPPDTRRERACAWFGLFCDR